MSSSSRAAAPALADGHQGVGTRNSPTIALNTFLNLGGQVVPVLAGVLSIPFLIKGLGASRFGVLTLAWIVVGYFSLFDLGLGRALTKLVAERVGTEHEREVPVLARTALAAMWLLGVLGAVLGVALTPWLTTSVLRVPVELREESKHAFWLLAVSLPIVVTTGGLRGLLEGMQRFGWINAIRIPTGVFTFVGPLLVLPLSHNLGILVAVLVAGRAVGWFAHWLCCLKLMPEVFRHRHVDVGLLPLLVRFGGWMTVTNIVSPLMVYMDRLLIGALISAAAIAYYATPYEIITKLWLVPGSLLGVLFPAFSAGYRHDPEGVTRLFRRSTNILWLTILPATLLIVLFAREGLTLWLGAAFAGESAGVARWLAAGVFINSLAMVPFTLIQGAGRPDLTAKLHLMELLPYLLALWWFTTTHGIEGAAMIWTLRVSLDALLLYAMVNRFLSSGSSAVRHTSGALAIGIAALAVAALPAPTVLKMAYAAAVLLATGFLASMVLARGLWSKKLVDGGRL